MQMKCDFVLPLVAHESTEDVSRLAHFIPQLGLGRTISPQFVESLPSSPRGDVSPDTIVPRNVKREH